MRNKNISDTADPMLPIPGFSASVLEPVLEAEFALLWDPPDPKSIEPIDADLRYEAWVRAYLEDVAENYGITLCGDLDKETWGNRGDYRAKYKGEEVIVEVEKTVEDFFDHGHRTKGTRGWDDVGKIDLVFAAKGSKDTADKTSITVIIANTDHPEGTPTFDEWYGRAQARNIVFNDIPKEFPYVLDSYLALDMTAHFPDWSELMETAMKAQENNPEQWAKRWDRNYGFARGMLRTEINQILPNPDNRDEIFEFVQRFNTPSDLISHVKDDVEKIILSPADENNEALFECECGSKWFDICKDTRTLPPDEFANIADQSEGELAVQFAGMEDSSLVGGVVKDEVMLIFCPKCSELEVISQRISG